MATSLRTPLTPISLPSPTPTTRRHFPVFTIRCGPRDNRGPLVKGRILSIEAIHAVQSLKLAHNPRKSAINDNQITNTLARLLKSDLLAVLNELIRQNHCQLALRVFSVVRSEPWYSPDLATYATFVRALQKNGMPEEIDRLVEELEREVEGSAKIKWGDDKSLVRLIRALMEAGRKESTVRVYGMMKKGGWGVEESGVAVDEYVAKVLGRGLRNFGELGLAQEVDSAYESFSRACLQRFDMECLKRTSMLIAGLSEVSFPGEAIISFMLLKDIVGLPSQSVGFSLYADLFEKCYCIALGDTVTRNSVTL